MLVDPVIVHFLSSLSNSAISPAPNKTSTQDRGSQCVNEEPIYLLDIIMKDILPKRKILLSIFAIGPLCDGVGRLFGMKIHTPSLNSSVLSTTAKPLL